MELKNGKYYFSGGVEVIPVVEKYGTPVYVYEQDIIERQYKRLTNAFSTANLKIHFAAKALTNINILKLMRSLGAGLDAVSIQEVQLGLRAGFSPKEILFTPSGVAITELLKAVDLGVPVNIDSITILERFCALRPKHPVSIRINPHVMAGGNAHISVGHDKSKFGIPYHQMADVQRIIKKTGNTLVGVHMHTGSDILDADAFLKAANRLFETAAAFPDLRFIDFGSGFKVPYRDGDIETNIEEIGKKLSTRFNAFCEETGKQLMMIVEPGKFLVSEAGNLFATVNDVKETERKTFASLDTGLNHLLRPMMYDAWHDIVNISTTQKKQKQYTVVGYICETDTFGEDRTITEIFPGDIIGIKNAGAYGFMMASNYNSRLRPPEVLIRNGKDILIRRRETLEDTLATVC